MYIWYTKLFLVRFVAVLCFVDAKIELVLSKVRFQQFTIFRAGIQCLLLPISRADAIASYARSIARSDFMRVTS